jgi:hypothetical protein
MGSSCSSSTEHLDANPNTPLPTAKGGVVVTNPAFDADEDDGNDTGQEEVNARQGGGKPKKKSNAKQRGKEQDADNGREEVEKMIGIIKAQMGEFAAANAAVDANGGTPPSDSALAAVATEEACDAVGSPFSIARSLEQQLEQLVVRGGAAGAASFAADLDALRKDLATTRTTLQQAVASFVTGWKLQVPDISSLPTDPASFAALPIANQPGQFTMYSALC